MSTSTTGPQGWRSPLLTRGILPRDCPSRVVLDHITSRWGLLVLVALEGGTLRWSALRRIVEGVSEKMLAQTLQTLERDGFVLRQAEPVIPPRVDYSLTERGHEVVRLMLPLMEWIGENAMEILSGSRPTAAGGTAG